jgi:hypothetical protein
MNRPAALLASLLAVAASGPGFAQQIQRCEDSRGKITYSNADCPEGTKPVRSVQAEPAPSPEAQQAARDKAARDAQAAQQLAEQRRSQQATAAKQRQQQRDADCAFLQGEIQSTQRMRNMLVNRPYYSLDDLEQMDQHAMQLMTEYERVCRR